MDPVSAERIRQLEELYVYWNRRINVISRKDVTNLYIHHVLHSLSLGKVIAFSKDETVLDLGTGGGFPGIPLAILNPDVQFTLLDGTGKKISVVENVVRELQLTNVNAVHSRAENFKGRFNYIVSRAVSSFPSLVGLSAGKLINGMAAAGYHGIYSLKGGNVQDEVAEWKDKVKIYSIGEYFKEEFFKTKCIIFLPSKAAIKR